MSRTTRILLMSGVAVAAISLAFGPVAAQDDEGAMEEMSSMEPMASMEPMGSMEPMEPGLHVRDAWTRESPMVDLAGAAYMIIHNNSDADDALIGASSPAAEVVEIHLSSMDDEGMMSMQQVEEIAIPAHGDAVLKPGSYHIMLIGLVEPLTEGSEVELSLEFMTAEPQTVGAPVMAGPPMMSDMDHDMDDMGHDADDMDDEEMEHEMEEDED